MENSIIELVREYPLASVTIGIVVVGVVFSMVQLLHEKLTSSVNNSQDLEHEAEREFAQMLTEMAGDILPVHSGLVSYDTLRLYRAAVRAGTARMRDILGEETLAAVDFATVLIPEEESGFHPKNADRIRSTMQGLLLLVGSHLEDQPDDKNAAMLSKAATYLYYSLAGYELKQHFDGGDEEISSLYLSGIAVSGPQSLLDKADVLTALSLTSVQLEAARELGFPLIVDGNQQIFATDPEDLSCRILNIGPLNTVSPGVLRAQLSDSIATHVAVEDNENGYETLPAAIEAEQLSSEGEMLPPEVEAELLASLEEELLAEATPWLEECSDLCHGGASMYLEDDELELFDEEEEETDKAETKFPSTVWIASDSEMASEMDDFDMLLMAFMLSNDIDNLFDAQEITSPDEFVPAEELCMALLMELEDSGTTEARELQLKLFQLCARFNRYRLAKMNLLTDLHYAFFEMHEEESAVEDPGFLELIVDPSLKGENPGISFARDPNIVGEPLFYVTVKEVREAEEQALPVNAAPVYGPQLQDFAHEVVATPAGLWGHFASDSGYDIDSFLPARRIGPIHQGRQGSSSHWDSSAQRFDFTKDSGNPFPDSRMKAKTARRPQLKAELPGRLDWQNEKADLGRWLAKFNAYLAEIGIERTERFETLLQPKDFKFIPAEETMNAALTQLAQLSKKREWYALMQFCAAFNRRNAGKRGILDKEVFTLAAPGDSFPSCDAILTASGTTSKIEMVEATAVSAKLDLSGIRPLAVIAMF